MQERQVRRGDEGGQCLRFGVTSAAKNPKRIGKIAIEVTPLEATSTSLRAPRAGARAASFAAVLPIQKTGWGGLQRESPETYVGRKSGALF